MSVLPELLRVTANSSSAYLGNQQFTSHHLIFVQCDTAMQIHWDWAWTMQDIIIESCRQGVVIVGKASNYACVSGMWLTSS